LVLLILLLAVLDEYFKRANADETLAFTVEDVYPTISPSVITASSLPAPRDAPNPAESSHSPPTTSSLLKAYRIQTVYVHSSHPFAEVDAFVEKCVEEYHLNLLRYDEKGGMKSAFQKYLDQNKDIKTIFVGTRRTDPHGGLLKHFDMTDGGWPSFMRCHPVIDWHYADVWGVSASLSNSKDLITVVYVFGLSARHQNIYQF
jgi:hypothetical protein